MARLDFADRNSLNNKKQKATELILSFFTAFLFILCFADIFDIGFDISKFYRGGIVSGFAFFFNNISKSYLINDDIVLKTLKGAAEGCELFMLLLSVAVAVAIYFIIKKDKKRLLLIFPIFLILTLLTTKATMSSYKMLLFSALLIIDYGYIKQKNRLSGGLVTELGLILIIMISITCFSITAQFLEMPDFAKNIGQKITELKQDIKYGKSPLGSGQITGEDRNVDEDEIALKLTTSKPEATYLRGFIGETYSAGKWQKLPSETYLTSKNLIYWLCKNDFNPAGQLGNAGELIGKDSEIKYSIDVKKAYKKYPYIPYEYKETSEEWVNRYGSFFTKWNLAKMKDYSYTAGENGTSDWTKTASILLSASEEAQNLSYFQNESYYNQFIYENYTYLDTSQMQLMQTYIGDRGDQSEGHVQYKEAIQRVKDYLDKNYVYTDNPGLKKSTDGDIIQAFFSTKKGYDIHFATAATFIFRYYGIPARYVEGYLVTPADVEGKKAGDEIDIYQKNIHAWVEIYIDGIGFVPIEVSPDYYDVMPTADMSIGFENSILDKNFQGTDGNLGIQNDASYDTKNENENTIFKTIIKIVMIFLLIALMLFILRKVGMEAISRYKQAKVFKKAEPDKAIAAIYQFIEKNYMDYINDELRDIGNKAAYSREKCTEDERQRMLGLLKEIKECKRKDKKIK